MLKFKYTKENGETSDRRAILLAPARINNLMIDVSHLPEEEALKIDRLFGELKDAQDALVDNLRLSGHYRTFKPEGIKLDNN